MNLYLIPKDTPIVLYYIDTTPIWEDNKHERYKLCVSDQEAIIDLDELHIQHYNQGRDDECYTSVVNNISFNVQKKYLIKL